MVRVTADDAPSPSTDQTRPSVPRLPIHLQLVHHCRNHRPSLVAFTDRKVVLDQHDPFPTVPAILVLHHPTECLSQMKVMAVMVGRVGIVIHMQRETRLQWRDRVVLRPQDFVRGRVGKERQANGRREVGQLRQDGRVDDIDRCFEWDRARVREGQDIE